MNLPKLSLVAGSALPDHQMPRRHRCKPCLGLPFLRKIMKSPMIKPSHKGRLHTALGVPQGQKIPPHALTKALHSSNPHVRQMAQFAANMNKD